MSWFAWSLVIFLTALAAIGGPAWWMGRRERIPFDRLADPRPLPWEPPMIDSLAGCDCGCGDALPIAGYFDLPDTLARFAAPDGPYGPWPVDTGPLLILSEQAAANMALEREIRQRCAEAEAKIPPRWR